MANELKFLIVDDQLMIRTMLKTALKSIGYSNIKDVANGQLGLSEIENSYKLQQPFDIVFVDYMMPEMSGLELVKSCRDNSMLKSTTFIMITAEQSKELVIEAAKLGVKAYIVKPFDKKTLEEKIKLTLEKRA